MMVLFAVSLYGQQRVYAPSLSLPENGEIELAPNITLDWKAVTGETLEVLYELQIASMEDFSDAITFPKTDITSKEMTELNFGATYFWRVKAYDGDNVSDWSEAWSFTIATTVSLDQPNDGAMVFADPNISWNELTGLSKYQIQIDTSYIWNNVVLPITKDIFGSFIINETNMWLVGDAGTLLHFDSTNWSIVDAGTSEALNDIYFVDATHGFIVGDNGTFLSYDGNLWTALDAGITDNLTAVAFADADNGYAVGDGGLILKYSSGTFTIETAMDGGSEITDNLYDIDVVDANNYWACGKGKVVINYDGTEWTGGDVGSKDHYSVWFNTANDGWIASKSGKINHYDGTEWTEISGITSKNLYGISFDGPIGYAVGKSGTMLVYDGAEWSQITSGTTSNLNTIFVNEGYGIAAGDDGSLINKAGEGFNSPFAKIISVDADSNNYSFTNLLFGKSFYYRMRALHSLDTSAWSGAKSMTTFAHPDLESPSNGSSDEALKITFEWSEYSGVTRYYIEVSKTEDFAASLNYISDSNSVTINNFNFSQQYFWRVRAEHPDDISDWTDPNSFTTLDNITLLTPEDNAIGINRSVQFVWELVPGAVSYEIYIDKNSNFPAPEIGFTEKSNYQIISPLDEKETYYWKVRGVAGLDTSSWSNVWSFEVEGPDAIKDIFTNKSVKLYPNPSNGNFNIDINSIDIADYQITITDMTGKLIHQTSFTSTVGSNLVSLNIGDKLSEGIYMIDIKRNEISVNKKLFIK
jgi:photosystem II stability/assembly factor-like uncharacterized protein